MGPVGRFGGRPASSLPPTEAPEQGRDVLLPRSAVCPPAGSLDTGRAVAAARPGADCQTATGRRAAPAYTGARVAARRSSASAAVGAPS